PRPQGASGLGPLADRVGAVSPRAAGSLAPPWPDRPASPSITPPEMNLSPPPKVEASGGRSDVHMRPLPSAALLALAAAGIVLGPATIPVAAQDRDALRPVSAFADIKDAPERSRALFREALKVIANPRCM